MKKIILIISIIFMVQNNVNSNVLVIVKNKKDKNLFIKRTKPDENEAINSALKGCQVFYKYREDISYKEKKVFMASCYIFRIIEQ